MVLFLEKLERYFDFDIYIHTWDVNEASSSWRNLEKPSYNITEQYIYNYFSRYTNNIKYIKIENDNDVQLYQDTQGVISTGSKMKKLPWKRMWHGKKLLIDAIEPMNRQYKHIINTRFDYFTRIINDKPSLVYEIPYIIDTLINNIRNVSNIRKPDLYFIFDTTCLISNTLTTCIDNFYFGSFKYMKHLAYSFHYNLDNIIESTPEWNRINQEHLVFLEGMKINMKNPTINLNTWYCVETYGI
jgi:hypothetical protein